jgi:hypothetical protein
MPAFAKRWRLAQLSRPEAYELVEVHARRGMTKALLFSKALYANELQQRIGGHHSGSSVRNSLCG